MPIPAVATHPALRIATIVSVGLLTLVLVAAVMRPPMMGMAMKMLHGLFVGFGL